MHRGREERREGGTKGGRGKKDVREGDNIPVALLCVPITVYCIAN